MYIYSSASKNSNIKINLYKKSASQDTYFYQGPQIWNKLKNQGKEIKLITLKN